MVGTGVAETHRHGPCKSCVPADTSRYRFTEKSERYAGGADHSHDRHKEFEKNDDPTA